MIRLFRPPRLIDWFLPSFTWRFVVSEQVVFLTFDDGPHPAITPFVLEELEKHQLKATFFCVGENMIRYPEIVQQLLAAGHSIGNHTMRHTKGTAVPDAEYFQSVNEFSDQFKTTLFRPPYGKIRRSQRKEVQKNYRLIMWSWLSYDFDTTIPVRKILQKAKSIVPGDIIVLHDNSKIAERQRELLPALLQQLRDRGFTSRVIPGLSVS